MPRCLSVWASVFPLLFVQVGFCGAVHAQQPSGRAVGVIPDASALRSDGPQMLAVQQPVYMGDRIQTGTSGEAQIDFIDTTRLVVGPSSSLLIDSTVMRNRRTMNAFVVSALRGTFRFISGTSPKPAYAIRTPTATIGVRGTEFDFAVLRDGSTEFVLFKGQAQVCDRSGNCTVVRGSCNAVLVPLSGPIRPLLDREERNARLRANFPYVRARNASLRPEFRTDVRTCGNIEAAAVAPEPADPVTRSAPTAAPGPPAPSKPAPNVPSSPERPNNPPAPPSRQPEASPQIQQSNPPPTPEPPRAVPDVRGHTEGDKVKDHHGYSHRDRDGRGSRNDSRDSGGRDHRSGERNSRDGDGRRSDKASIRSSDAPDESRNGTDDDAGRGHGNR